MDVMKILNRHIFHRLATIGNAYIIHSHCSYTTAQYLEIVLSSQYTKRELLFSKYFGNNLSPIAPTSSEETQLKIDTYELNNEFSDNGSIQDIVRKIENYMKGESKVPNNPLYSCLVYFAKNGDISGIAAVQFIIKKYNNSHFKLNSEYNHYMAEALWIDGKIIASLKLFSDAYDNQHIQSKVKSKMSSLFPLLTTKYSEAAMWKTVNFIEQFSSEKQDVIIFAYLWKALFESEWFSDQQISKEILHKNESLLQIIQCMVPMMGRTFLQHHKIDNFYRLIELTLENNLKTSLDILLQLLFDYYYIHRNIERCTAVVKYSQNLGYSLTELQQHRYVNLLLNHKHSESSIPSMKKSPKLKYTF